MNFKIRSNELIGHGPIKVLYPGNKTNTNDSGIGSIGRIDYALFEGANIIPMHPHVNDEILTYLRSGNVNHEDSEGITESLSNTKLMLMKAGRRFYHEEKILDLGKPLEGLQIFIRPKVKDINPQVNFLDLKMPYSINEWRLIASPNENSILQFTSDTWIYDMRVNKNTSFNLPKLEGDNLVYLLFVFNGKIENKDIILEKKESLVFKDNTMEFFSDINSDLVLFVTNMNSEVFKGGMFSGNIK